jgi:aryl-alcohol dehydrogenase-like predicted oxidoreductase
VDRVGEIAEKYNVTMTQIALARQFAKGMASPIVGVSKIKYLDDVVGVLDVILTEEDVKNSGLIIGTACYSGGIK